MSITEARHTHFSISDTHFSYHYYPKMSIEIKMSVHRISYCKISYISYISTPLDSLPTRFRYSFSFV